MSGIFFIFAACFIWALDTLIRYPLMAQGVSAGTIVLLEHFFLVAMFIPFYIRHFKEWRNLNLKILAAFLVIGVLGSAVATLSFTHALGLINPSIVILMQKLQPVVAIIAARLILNEPIRPRFLFWAAFCLAGAMLISHGQINDAINFLFKPNSSIDMKGLSAIIFSLISVFCWGLSTVFGKILSNKGISEWGIIAGRYLAGVLILLPLYFSMNVNLAQVGGQVYGKVFVIAFFSGIVAMYLYYQGLKVLSARLCTLAEMFFPFCAVIVNWIFLNATLDIWQLCGGLVLIIGSGVLQWKKY